MSYELIRDSLKVGDVVAFSGKGRVSEIIKWRTGSHISHVGMVSHVNDSGEYRIQLIESTTLGNLPDIKTGKAKKGVQLQHLSQRIATYDGSIWIYPLKEAIKNPIIMNDWLRTIHLEERGYDALQAIGAGADLFDWIPGIEMEPDFNSLFCSELVCRALQLAGVVSDELNPSEQTPADVCGYCCFKSPTRLK